ncbi:MerR family transcriptional regulator [Vibrio sp. AK197]
MDYKSSNVKKWYAIREVSEMTGVKPVTLRAWQRRYNLIHPHRTEKGHRLYSQAHIDHIRLIQSWLAKGVAIGKVKELIDGNQPLHAELEASQVQRESIDTLLNALAQLQLAKVTAMIRGILKEYPIAMIEARLVDPIIQSLSQVKKPQRSLQMGLFQSAMITALSAILESENKAAHKGGCLVVNCEASGCIGAWIWAISIAGQGYTVTVLDGVTDLSGLVTHASLDKQWLAVYANHTLPATQKNALKQLGIQLGERLMLSPLLNAFDKSQEPV